MVDNTHKKVADQGVAIWNDWRIQNPGLIPNLNGIDLSGQDWSGANFSRTDFVGANLENTNLEGAILTGALGDSGIQIGRSYFDGANLRNANLNRSDLRRANFVDADLSEATLIEANLSESNLTNAKFIHSTLTGANLNKANLVKTDFKNADLDGCFIYGISTWDLNVVGTKQSNLIITPLGASKITVDNIQVAQFIYLLLNNIEIRNTIDTIASKAVLILGRFSSERKLILDGIKNKLRDRNYLPIMFDFEKPSNRDLTETITTLAGLSKFIIADLTDAKSIPHELQSIIPNLLSVPVQPIILEGEREYAMFEHFTRYPSVLPIYQYASASSLIKYFDAHIISEVEREILKI
jgi:uncharacterized protein YjbI with pentapeptide repeats